MDARTIASWEEKVDFPTPPLPLSTRILFFIDDIFSLIIAKEGSGAFCMPEAHMFWLGHPLHESSLPACVDLVPGQWAFALSGTSLSELVVSIFVDYKVNLYN